MHVAATHAPCFAAHYRKLVQLLCLRRFLPSRCSFVTASVSKSGCIDWRELKAVDSLCSSKDEARRIAHTCGEAFAYAGMIESGSRHIPQTSVTRWPLERSCPWTTSCRKLPSCRHRGALVSLQSQLSPYTHGLPTYSATHPLAYRCVPTGNSAAADDALDGMQTRLSPLPMTSMTKLVTYLPVLRFAPPTGMRPCAALMGCMPIQTWPLRKQQPS